MKTNAKFIYSILVGAGVGALIGYFFYNNKGSQLRRNALSATRDFAENIGNRVAEGVDRLAERTSDVRGEFRNKAEDISEQIVGGFDKTKSKSKQYLGRNK
jgi:gas vesicle protein